MRADQVGGHEVRRELDAFERPVEDVGQRLDRQGLGESGHALEQQMAAGEERDEDPLEHGVLADDDAPDLVEDGFARRARVGGRLRRSSRIDRSRNDLMDPWAREGMRK